MAVFLRSWLKTYFQTSNHAKFSTSMIVLSLFILSLSQAVLVVLFGPVLKALISLGDGENANFRVSEIIPPGPLLEILPIPPDWTIARKEVVVLFPWVFLCVAVLRSLGSFLFQHFSLKFSIELGSMLRDRALTRVFGQTYESIVQKSVGEWMAILVHDVFLLQRVIADICIGMIKEAAMVAAAVVGLLFVAPVYGVVLVLLLPLLLFGLRRQALRIQFFSEWWQSQIRKMATHIIELRKRFSWVVVNGGVEFERKGFLAICDEYFSAMKKSFVTRATFSTGVELIGFFAIALVLWLSFSKENSGFAVNPAEGPYILALLGALGLVVRPLRAVGEYWSRFAELEGSLKPLRELLDPSEKKDDVFTRSHSHVHPNLEGLGGLNIERCVVTYLEDHLSDDKEQKNLGQQIVIEDLKIEHGKFYAVVGESGSGKSTFLKVLAGLVEPTDWKSSLSLESAVNLCHYVGQRSFLFDGSLRENLNYGNDQVNFTSGLDFDEKARSVLTKVRLSEKGGDSSSNLLERRLSTFDGGLSGGERQRLMVARSLLWQKKIYCYDEVTSGLDEVTECAILNLLRAELVESRKAAVLVVTHRLKNVKMFDRILHFDRGRFLGQISPEDAEGVLQFKTDGEFKV